MNNLLHSKLINLSGRIQKNHLVLFKLKPRSACNLLIYISQNKSKTYVQKRHQLTEMG